MKKWKIIGLIIAATIALSAVTAVTASAANYPNNHKQYYFANNAEGYNYCTLAKCNEVLDRLVAAGSISTYQEQEILKALSNAEQSGGWVNMHAVLWKLVRAGTINPYDQAEIERALAALNSCQRYDGDSYYGQDSCNQDSYAWFKERLDSLVSAGKINTYQEGAILTALANTAQYGDWLSSLNTVLGNLVNAGTIDWGDRAEVVEALTGQYPEHRQDGNSCGQNTYDHGAYYWGTYKERLDRLVLDGVINSYQEGAILKGLSNMPNSGDGWYNLHAVLENLVSAGTITVCDQEKIERALTGQYPNHNGNGCWHK